MYHLSPDTTAVFLKNYKHMEDFSIEDVEVTFSKDVNRYKVTPTGKRAQNSGTTIAYCAFGDIELVCSRWGAPMIGDVLADRGTLSIGFPISGVTELHDPNAGKVIAKPSEARMFRAGVGVSLVGQGPRTVMDLVLPYQTLQDRARSFNQNELNNPLQFSPILDLNSAGGRLMVNLVEYLKTLVINEPAIVQNPLNLVSLQEYVISTVLGMLPHNYNMPRSGAIDCAVPRSVRKAEDYMRAFADQPVTVEDLARQAGCSERALHNAFKTFRQKSPMVVLRDIRLECAHDDLQAGESTIADIAFKWGFSNLGRFSKHYAQKFGCKPSQTLKFAAS